MRGLHQSTCSDFHGSRVCRCLRDPKLIARRTTLGSLEIGGEIGLRVK